MRFNSNTISIAQLVTRVSGDNHVMKEKLLSFMYKSMFQLKLDISTVIT